MISLTALFGVRRRRRLISAVSMALVAGCGPGQHVGEQSAPPQAQPRSFDAYGCNANEELIPMYRAEPIISSEPPEPWEYSDEAQIFGPPPAHPGYRARPADLGFDDPEVDAMDHMQANPNFPLYRFIVFSVGRGYAPECGRGGYLIASPSRIDELIAQSLWRPNDLSYFYEGKPDGLSGYGSSVLHFVNDTRRTQCRALSLRISESGEVSFRAPLPTIQCHISHSPDYAITITIPGRMYPYLGTILTRIDQDARMLVSLEHK